MNYTSFIFPGIRAASRAAREGYAIGLFLYVLGVAEEVKAWQPYFSESNYLGSSPSIGIYLFTLDILTLTNTQVKWYSNTPVN
jgi:hypothetical protein